MKKEIIVCDHCGHVFNEEERRTWIRLFDNVDGFSQIIMSIESLNGDRSKRETVCCKNCDHFNQFNGLTCMLYEKVLEHPAFVCNSWKKQSWRN